MLEDLKLVKIDVNCDAIVLPGIRTLDNFNKIANYIGEVFPATVLSKKETYDAARLKYKISDSEIILEFDDIIGSEIRALHCKSNGIIRKIYDQLKSSLEFHD